MTKTLACAVGLFAVTALAAEPQVLVQADVVLALEAAGPVAPDLVSMQQRLAEKKKYGTLKKLESKRLELVRGQAQSLALPNQKTAEVTLQDVKDNVATVKLKVPPTEAVYSLAKGKTLYFQGGAHEGGDLWLLVSQPKK